MHREFHTARCYGRFRRSDLRCHRRKPHLAPSMAAFAQATRNIGRSMAAFARARHGIDFSMPSIGSTTSHIDFSMPHVDL
ncbi:hypothetical protein [Sorangium sp. So ce341]|uniref:hypothetical protein n=1 Tax=Sorangium sp. So ce341 TaxID=3133302 RepID=UPI003F647DBA